MSSEETSWESPLPCWFVHFAKLIQTNTMPIVFWYLTFILTSEKYYSVIVDRIRSYARPNATIDSDSLFNLPNLLSAPLLLACFQETLRLRGQNGPTRIVNKNTTIPVNDRHFLLRKD